MEDEKPFWVTSVAVGALFCFVLINLAAMSWYVLDLAEARAGAAPPILSLDGQSKFRNYWEIVYFVSGSGLAISAVFAFFVARRQLLSTENVRLASVYMEISKRWGSRELLRSRMKLTELVEFYERNRARPEFAAYRAPGEYIRDVLMEFLATDRIRLHDYIQVAAFFEDVGVLCRRNYVRSADLFDFLGGPIERYGDHLLPYMLAVRGDGEKGRAIYANALWLYRAVKKRQLFEDNGAGLPMPPR